MAKKKRAAVEAVKENKTDTRPSLLSGIGLFGLSHLEPVILAALATEAPLLLIGPHGTGKSLLLTRIAEALGLVFRHYNASLLNFDDLLNFYWYLFLGHHYLIYLHNLWLAGCE